MDTFHDAIARDVGPRLTTNVGLWPNTSVGPAWQQFRIGTVSKFSQKLLITLQTTNWLIFVAYQRRRFDKVWKTSTVSLAAHCAIYNYKFAIVTHLCCLVVSEWPKTGKQLQNWHKLAQNYNYGEKNSFISNQNIITSHTENGTYVEFNDVNSNLKTSFHTTHAYRYSYLTHTTFTNIMLFTDFYYSNLFLSLSFVLTSFCLLSTSMMMMMSRRRRMPISNLFSYYLPSLTVPLSCCHVILIRFLMSYCFTISYLFS